MDDVAAHPVPVVPYRVALSLQRVHPDVNLLKLVKDLIRIGFNQVFADLRTVKEGLLDGFLPDYSRT